MERVSGMGSNETWEITGSDVASRATQIVALGTPRVQALDAYQLKWLRKKARWCLGFGSLLALSGVWNVSAGYRAGDVGVILASVAVVIAAGWGMSHTLLKYREEKRFLLERGWGRDWVK